jgi:transposase
MRFEYAMLVFCQIMTQKAAAQLLHIAQSTLSDQLHRSIERIRNGYRIRNLRSIGVDEISYRKRHKYATIVYDNDTPSACDGVSMRKRGLGRNYMSPQYKNRFFPL